MSAPVRRKRGRPRLDEPKEIQDFDNNLIQEFKKFPAFYDRQHPQHRNREVTDRIWQRLAQNLNVSITLAKTRMLQLRNRFNLEKRRIEAMKEQQPELPATSQWNLYESLSFLSDYVKPRRPYLLSANNHAKIDNNATSSDAEDEEDDEENNRHHSEENILNSNQMLLNGSGGYVGSIQQPESNRSHSTTANNNISHQIPIPMYNSNLDLNNYDGVGNNKYKAFGQFLASSLIEMNELQALMLVEKFTTEMVKYLKIEERKKLSLQNNQQSSTIDDESDDVSVNGY